MSQRAFSEWVADVHGASGRLLLWDESRRWWVVHEPDLELAVFCAPRGMFREEPDQLSWWHLGTAEGRREVERLRARYGITGER